MVYIFYHKNSTTMKNAFKKAAKANINEWVIVQVMLQFYMPNAMGVVHIASDTIKFLQSNPDKYIRIYNSNSQPFITEVLRMRTPLPFINSFLWIESKQIEIHGKKYEFPAITPCQIQLTMVNHDINIFGGISKRKDHSHRFDQSRNTLDQTIPFRGVWNELKNDNIGARPTRYCPVYQMVMNKGKVWYAQIRNIEF